MFNRLKTFLLIMLFVIPIGVRLSAQDSIQPPNPDGLTKIYISMLVNSISDINAATQIIKADLFLTASWKDPRLAHSGNRRYARSDENIWAPFLTIVNHLSIQKQFGDEITILGDGTVIYIQRVYGEFTQDFRLRDFPMDEQTFSFRIMAIGFTSDDVELVPSMEESGISNEFRLHDWNILDWKFDANKIEFMKGQPPLPALTYQLSLERQSGFYFLIYVIPLVLIIMMSLLVYWLKPELSSSQISLATTSMLTLIAYRFIVSGTLPKISYMTRMDIFVLGSSILIFVTLVEAVLTASLTTKGKKELAAKIDIHCRWIFPLLYVSVFVIAFAI